MFFFFSSRRRHTRFDCDWSSDVCSSDLRHVLSGVEEPGVVVDRLFRQRLEPGARAERAPRLVERDMPVRADAQDLQVDPAALPNALLVPLAEGRVIAGGARGAVDGVSGEVDMLEEVLVH